MTSVTSEKTSEKAGETSSENIPISKKERIQSIDTLRGVAVFGILLMNIIAFAYPFAAYSNPAVDGATQGLDLFAFASMDVMVEGAMRALFSMLFGAGMLIFLNKPGADEAVVKGLFYRRTVLLIGFGLVNAYLFVWVGDILYAYGVTGLLLYFFRNLEAKRLAIYSMCMVAVLMLLHSGLHFSTKFLESEANVITSLPAGTELTVEQQESLDAWDAFLAGQSATPELIEEEMQIKKSGYVDNFIHAAEENIFLQTVVFVAFVVWDVLSMMLLGMACWKWGLFDASRSMGFYTKLTLISFGIGIPINLLETMVFINSGFDFQCAASARRSYDIGRLTLAFGYIGLVMMICKSGVLSAFRNGMAAVGQMALTNYLSQSVICNFIFMGFGLGLVGELARHQVYYVVFGVWLFHVVFSVFWLKNYRFGPAEWLWRSMTYKKKQAMKL